MFGCEVAHSRGKFWELIIVMVFKQSLGVYHVEILTPLSGVDLECLVEQWMIIGMSWDVAVVRIIYLREYCSFFSIELQLFEFSYCLLICSTSETSTTGQKRACLIKVCPVSCNINTRIARVG
jgi:hypothetical protein